jgi:hypothetical protein
VIRDRVKKSEVCIKKIGDILDEQKFSAPKKFNTRSQRPYYKGDSFDFLSLIAQWEDIIGPKLAKHTIPIKNRYRVLTIMTDHPAYSQQLSFMETQIIEKISRRFPELALSLKKIIFQVNTRYFNQKADELRQAAQARPNKTSEKKVQPKKIYHPYDPQVRRFKQEAESEFSDIEDSEIRENLISLFIQKKMEKKSS